MTDLYVPGDSTARAAGADDVAAAIRREAERRALSVKVIRNGSRGMFWLEPLVEIAGPAGRTAYGPVAAADVPGLFDAGWLHGQPHALALGLTEAIPYLKCQQRLSFARMGVTDPLSLADYQAHQGWAGLRQALAVDVEGILRMVSDAGLRDRDALPTAGKWRRLNQASAEPKLVVCNADDGDATDYAERMVLEGDPYMLIEGMSIAALAIGATQGCVCIGEASPRACGVFAEAAVRARAAGFLGPDVLGSGKAFEIEVRKAARGEPPPFDRPTLVDSVQTLVAVPLILAKGAAFYRDFGFGKSIGTQPFHLAGNLRQGGLVELAFGVTLRALLYDYGGGSASGRPLTAVRVGGPRGALLPESQWDIPLDHEACAAAGLALGDGAIVAYDDCVDPAQVPSSVSARP